MAGVENAVAKMRGVHPSAMRALTLAPAVTRSCTIRRFFVRQAMCKGVLPAESQASKSEPHLNNTRTASCASCSAASISGVQPP